MPKWPVMFTLGSIKTVYYFILEGSEQKVESVISDDHGTSAGASCLDQGTLILFS